jgi:hypothetical protein
MNKAVIASDNTLQDTVGCFLLEKALYSRGSQQFFIDEHYSTIFRQQAHT